MAGPSLAEGTALKRKDSHRGQGPWRTQQKEVLEG